MSGCQRRLERRFGGDCARPCQGGIMINRKLALRGALLLGVSLAAGQSFGQVVAPTTPPDPPKFDAQGEPVFVNRADIYTYKALASYSEPAFEDAFVKAGKLPAVADRLPKEPLV